MEDLRTIANQELRTKAARVDRMRTLTAKKVNLAGEMRSLTVEQDISIRANLAEVKRTRSQNRAMRTVPETHECRKTTIRTETRTKVNGNTRPIPNMETMRVNRMMTRRRKNRVRRIRSSKTGTPKKKKKRVDDCVRWKPSAWHVAPKLHNVEMDC
uniref:Uncharacterized protein n=1 Tax=Cacopsylla melanoneura TaxID=428564 RepID=A0A8D8W652_9HEMI